MDSLTFFYSPMVLPIERPHMALAAAIHRGEMGGHNLGPMYMLRKEIIVQPIWVIIVGLAFFGLGCDRWFVEAAERTREGNATQQFAEISKVKVDRSGTIYLNKRIVTIEVLKQEFARLKEGNGAVWYYRENPQGEPPPQAMAVIQAIVDARLPVRLMERDFE